LHEGARYRTEVENFTIIEMKTFSSNGETFPGFEIRGKNGDIQEFGSSADGQAISTYKTCLSASSCKW
jgi:hypothetical protein